MKRLHVLNVSFEQAIRPKELEYFRAAVAEKAGLQHEYYHNHNNAPDASVAYHYRYPLIQYTLNRGLPTILFLEDAITEARHFFAKSDWELHFNGRRYESNIAELKATEHVVDVQPGQWHQYRLSNWQALNMKNHKAYQATIGLRDKIALLEKVLVSQILAFSTGIGYRLPHRLEVAMTDWHGTGSARYKGVAVQTFDLSFRTNILLPPGIGLGKGVSLGFGRCWREGETSLSQSNNA